MVVHSAIHGLEGELETLAAECFPHASVALSKETEFHAVDISSGARNFKRLRDQAKRFEILKRLAHIINKPEGVYRVAVRLEPGRMVDGVDVEAMAFTFFVERVNAFAKAKGSLTMLIGDFDRDKTANRAIQDLAQYRRSGTPYAFGRDIDCVVDTVHFAHSHHSRMLHG